MATLTIVRGDATTPRHGIEPAILAHITNDRGAWGRGFVLAVSSRWPHIRTAYQSWYRNGQDAGFALGAVQLVQATESVWIANMVAQHGLRPTAGVSPIRYDALELCLTRLAEHASRLNASVHMPRIGTGLAGGRWEQIEPRIRRALCERGIPVTVYDLPDPDTARR